MKASRTTLRRFIGVLTLSLLGACATPTLRTESTLRVIVQQNSASVSNPVQELPTRVEQPVAIRPSPRETAVHSVSQGQVTLPVPNGLTVHVVGMTNSGWWPQEISVQLGDQSPVTWRGTGRQSNDIVGSLSTHTVDSGQSSVTVQMNHDPGQGMIPSAMQWIPYEMAGLSGYVVGGQDSGGRPNGPAYWNTTVFVYWAQGY